MIDNKEKQPVLNAGLPGETSDFEEIEYIDMDFLEVDGAPPVIEVAKTKVYGTPLPEVTEKEQRGDVAIAEEPPAEVEAVQVTEDEAGPLRGDDSAAGIILDEEMPETLDDLDDAVIEKAVRQKIGKEYLGLSEDILGRIPDDFEINGIGAVDLLEAEEIANETLLIINEKEIMEQLEGLREPIVERKKGIEGSEELESIGEEEQAFVEKALDSDTPTIKTPPARKDPGAVEKKKIAKPIRDQGTKPKEVPGKKPETDKKSSSPPRGKEQELSGTDLGSAVIDYVPRGPSDEKELYGGVMDIDVFGDRGDQPGIRKPDESGVEPARLPVVDRASVAVPVKGRREAATGITAVTPVRAEGAFTAGSREILPRMPALDGDSGVYFIDDMLVEGVGSDTRSALEVTELEKITSDLMDIEVGQAITLPEGDMISEDSMPLSSDLKYLQDDFIFEFVDELKYRDDELEFVHTSIIEDDYGTYLREIDEFDTVKGNKGVTRAVELFGLTDDELAGMYEKLFGEEYKDIDLHEIFDFFRDDSMKRGLGPSIEKECIYVSDVSDSLDEGERHSIEDDISSANALIFEENIDDIRRLLGKSAKEVISEKVKLVDEIKDITDKVVIIDDEDDIDRFVKDFPDEKRHGLKKLLQYLDGLFEKLPETTMKTFANSEYFDLYIKVMNDLEV